MNSIEKNLESKKEGEDFTFVKVEIYGNQKELLECFQKGKMLRFVYDGERLYLGNMGHLEICRAADIKPYTALEGCFALSVSQDWQEIDFEKGNFSGITSTSYELRPVTVPGLRALANGGPSARANLLESISQQIYNYFVQIGYGPTKA